MSSDTIGSIRLRTKKTLMNANSMMGQDLNLFPILIQDLGRKDTKKEGNIK